MSEELSPELLESLGEPDDVAAGGEPLSEEQRAQVEEITEALRDVIDPELGINIVDLGLLYGMRLEDRNLVLDMTLTSAGCPLTDLIEQQCKFVLSDLVDSTTINWVWMPPWGPDKITPQGREQLRSLGFNV